MGRTDIKPSSQSRRERLVSWTPYIVVGVVLLILPPFMGASLPSIMTKVLIFGIFALSLNLLFGYTGLFSLGHAAYFAVGGYTAGILIIKYGIESFWLVAPAAILMATLVAAIFGIIALRVSGMYFLLVTFALGELVFSIALKWNSMTGGSNGLAVIPRPDLGLPLTWNPISFYYFAFIVFVICFFILKRIVNSSFGIALEGIRGSELRMRSLGYNTWLYKYIAFVIAGMFAGVAGVLTAHFNMIMAPSHASLLTSAIVMLMVIIGSDRMFFGPVVGAAVVLLLEYYSSIFTPQRWPLILGSVFILAVMFLRGGISIHLAKLWYKVKYRYGSTQS